MAENLGITTLAGLYKYAAEKYASSKAFATKNKNKQWDYVTYKELYEQGLALATALIDLGMLAKEHVGVLADNRYEWILSDAGILLAGGANVPRGTDVTDDDISYIIPHSDAKIVFVEHDKMLEKFQQNRSKLTNVKYIIMMDKESKATDKEILKIHDLVAKGQSLRQNGDRRAEERISAISAGDVATLIYTSGTTGAPKGVQLTHANLVSQVERSPIPLYSTDRFLSILPVWHIFERTFEYLAIGHGACTYYTNIRQIGEDIKNVKPTFMGSAPRLWESIYQKILDNVKGSSPIKQGLFNAAYFTSQIFQGAWFFLTNKKLDMDGRNPLVSFFMGLFFAIVALVFAFPYLLLDTIVLKKIRAATGGAFRGTVSGGGALPSHIDEFFNYIGVPVLEGYGMTETSPVISVRTFKKLVIGTVGPIFEDTDVRIIDLNSGSIIYTTEPNGNKNRGIKGEIHVRGPQVMKGYYKNEEATKKVLKDGWMNTGDLGMVTFNNCLKIMGRSKDTVVLTSGENVEPVPIENAIVESPYIAQCMVIGQDQKFLGALIVPSVEEFEKHGIKGDLKSLSENEEVKKKVQMEIKRLVSAEAGFKAFERIQDFRLIPKAFEVGDEMTNLFKLKRHVITDRYKKEIDSVFKD